MNTKELIEECRNFDTSIYRDAAHANSAMTAKLQEAADALQALQIKIEHWKTARDSAVFVGEQMQKQIKALQTENAANMDTCKGIIKGLQAEVDALKRALGQRNRLDAQLTGRETPPFYAGDYGAPALNKERTAIDAAKGNV